MKRTVVQVSLATWHVHCMCPSLRCWMAQRPPIPFNCLAFTSTRVRLRVALRSTPSQHSRSALSGSTRSSALARIAAGLVEEHEGLRTEDLGFAHGRHDTVVHAVPSI